MHNLIEKALFVHDEHDITQDADRIYFGCEFCERRIPSLKHVQRWRALAKAHSIQFTLVTPFVTEKGMGKLMELFRYLHNDGTHEVVFNDWGVLKILEENFPGLVPVAGRLLSKQRRDPRLLNILRHRQRITTTMSADKRTKIILFPKKVPQEIIEYYQGSVINVPVFQKFLVSRQVRRVELDMLAWDMDVHVHNKIGLSLYVPYAYVTCTRLCGKVTLTYDACGYECQKYYLALKAKASSAPLFSCGNTLFCKARTPARRELRKWGIDRIVLQPRFPL